MRYFESKEETYSNDKKKLFILQDGHLIPLIPFHEKHKNGASSHWLSAEGRPKEVNEEVLEKYYIEIMDRMEFLTREILHTPIK